MPSVPIGVWNGHLVYPMTLSQRLKQIDATPEVVFGDTPSLGMDWYCAAMSELLERCIPDMPMWERGEMNAAELEELLAWIFTSSTLPNSGA